MRRIPGFVAALAVAHAAVAAELTVMSVGAVKSPFVAVAGAWEKASGNSVSATFNPAGDVRRKLAAGAAADIIILPREDFGDLERDGAVLAGSRRDLGGVAMAAAVKKGAPVPDISTPEALKRTLLEAKSVTYMDPERGTSGKHFDETVLRRLGIRDEVRAKARLGEGGYIAEQVPLGPTIASRSRKPVRTTRSTPVRGSPAGGGASSDGSSGGSTGSGAVASAPITRGAAAPHRVLGRRDEERARSGRGAGAPRSPRLARRPQGVPRPRLHRSLKGPVALSLPSKKTLSLEAARVALAAAEAEARRNNWRVVIAVVDEGGHTLALVRLDGTQWSSVDTAVEKARAAVAWKRPTRLLEESVNQGRTAFVSISQGMALLQGGVPIEVEGAIIGAVGVSGVKASDDEVIALAAVNALKAALGP